MRFGRRGLVLISVGGGLAIGAAQLLNRPLFGHYAFSDRVSQAVLFAGIAVFSALGSLVFAGVFSGPTTGLTADQRQRIHTMIRSGQPDGDDRLRATATRISYDRLQRGTGPRAMIITAAFIALVGIGSALLGQYGDVILAALCLTILPGAARNTRRRQDEARAFLAAVDGSPLTP